MPDRKCPRCKKIFTRKSSYDCHINRKTKCRIISTKNKKDNIQKDFECEACGQHFCRKYNLERHITNDACRHYEKIPIEIEEFNKQSEEFNELIKELRGQIENLVLKCDVKFKEKIKNIE